MRILITGATSGIGAALVKRLAPSHELILLGRSPEKVAQVAGSIGAQSCIVDFSASQERIAEAIHTLSGRGRLDAIIHCAGEYEGAHLKQINAVAPMQLIRGLLPSVIGGTIVVINSTIIFSTVTTSYAESKRLLKRLTDELRIEANARDIRVTSIYPGRTATAMQERIMKSEGLEYHPERLLQPESVAQIIELSVGLPRSAEIVDLHVRPMRKY